MKHCVYVQQDSQNKHHKQLHNQFAKSMM